MKDKEKSRDQLWAEISELREEVQELKFYKAVLDQLPVCTILYDASETVIYRNRASKAIDGYEHQELVGLSRDEYLKQLHIKQGKAIKMKDPQKDSSYFKKSIYEMNETTLCTKNGTLRDVLLVGDFIYDEEENLLGACGCAVDITEHALKDNMYKLLAENAQDLIFRYRLVPSFQFEYVSPASSVIAGHRPEELYENAYRAFSGVHPDDRPLINAQLQSPQPLSATIRLVHKDGTTKWVEVKSIVVNDRYGNPAVEGIIRDVSERVQAERKLIENLRFLQKLIDTIPNPVYYKDNNGIFRGCNAAFETDMGFTKEEIMGRSIYELRTKDLADIYTEKDCELFRTNGKQVYETVIPYADGTMHDVVLYKGVFTDSNGGVAGLVGVIIDVTKSKETQRALSESEDLYRRLVELSPELIGVHDFTGEIVFSNQAGVKLLNAKNEAEIIGKNITQFIHPDCMQAVTEAMQKMLETNEPLHWFEQKLLTLDGSPFEVEATGVPLHFRGGPAVLVVARDITERKQWEREMSRLEQLNLVGQMAAGIGHEVRNPMTTVRGFLQMFQGKNDLMPYKNHLNLMIEELDRANSIIGHFLSLAKDKPVDKKVQNLNSIVEALSPMIQANVFRYDMYLELKLPEIPDLSLDEKEMRQLILNLCRNGMEAMSPGGTLSITTYAEDEEVVLSVADEGKGMQPEVMENLGTPFFTTKDNGTGLGLAVCYSISARHNASIGAVSTSEGTTFSVRFKLMG